MYPSTNAVPTRETPDEPRLRALEPWQATTVCLAAFALVLPALFLPGQIAGRVAPGALREPIVAGVMGALLAIAAIRCLAWFTRVPLGAFFIRRRGSRILAWIAITLGMVVILVGVAYLSGTTVHVATLAPTGVASRMAAAIAIGMWTGITEEFLLRGVLLSFVGHRWNWDGAILITALLFGLLHIGGGTTPVATLLYVSLTTVVGLLLGAIVVTSGTVWNAVAVHATWNAAFAGYLVGFESGIAPAPIVALPADGHWLLGVRGGTISESPLALGLFCLLGGVYWWRIRRIAPSTNNRS